MTAAPCRYCGDPDTAERFDVCRSCYYGGRRLHENMLTVLEILSTATRSRWEAEHTGGGCFWLRTYPNHDELVPVAGRPDVFDYNGSAAFIAVTAHGDVLSGFDDTPATCRDEWTVGVYPDGADGGEGTEYHETVTDEQLPVLVREIADRLRVTP